MKVERFPAGPLDTNGYLVSQNGKCIVIDPSKDSHRMISAIKNGDLELEAVTLTHSHFDHYLGIYELIEAFGDIPVYLHDDDRMIITNPDYSGAAWIQVTEGYTGKTIHYDSDKMHVGSFEFSVINCPGHTPGGVSLLYGIDCFTGDTLFRSGVGRSDFAYSDGAVLVDSIRNNLFALPDETVIWPGHGLESTIGREKSENPYL